jgi:hypothetical protein
MSELKRKSASRSDRERASQRVDFNLSSKSSFPGPPGDIAIRARDGQRAGLRQDVHDRVVFADERCWVIGQSIKDAAQKKPTYIVELDAEPMKRIYEDIWSRSQLVIGPSTA